MQTDMSPIERALAVTPNNASDIAFAGMTCLYVGTTGDVTGVLVGMDAAVTFPAMAGGMFHPVKFKRINATGTTATGLLVGG